MPGIEHPGASVPIFNKQPTRSADTRSMDPGFYPQDHASGITLSRQSCGQLLAYVYQKECRRFAWKRRTVYGDMATECPDTQVKLFLSSDPIARDALRRRYPDGPAVDGLLRRRQSDGLSRMCDQYSTMVYSVALRVLRDSAAAEDVYLKERGALVFTASNLVPLPANKTYELWVIPASGTAPIPAGTFQPDAHGMASVLLPNLPKGIEAKAFGVTMEKAGGSTTPTLPILLAGG
jgi:hypothetical protein